MAYSKVKKSLANPLELTASEVAVLTVPANGRYLVKNILVNDHSGAGSTVTIRKYSSALGNTAANNLFTAVVVSANGTNMIEIEGDGLPLNDGQILAAFAAHAARLSIDVCYEVDK